MLIVPVLLPVSVTWQEPELSVQLVLAGETPAPLSLKLIVPDGVVGEPDVSVTVAVQVEPWLITTGLVQETAVLVLCTPLA